MTLTRRPGFPMLPFRFKFFLITATIFVALIFLNHEMHKSSHVLRKSLNKVQFDKQNNWSLNATEEPSSFHASFAAAASSSSIPSLAASSSLPSNAPETNHPASSVSASSPSTTAAASSLLSSSSPSAAAPPRLLDNGKSCWMTNDVSGNDGWGSQWQHIAAAIVIAAKMGFDFAYTPMTKLEHLVDVYDREKILEMEVFAGFSSFRSIREVAVGIPSHTISDPHQAVCDGPVLYRVKNPKNVLDGNPDWWVEKRGLLRQIYFSTPKPDLSNVFPANRTNVVAFQRRFNKLWDSRCTFHPNEYFIQVMAIVRTKHSNATFHVVSQSNMTQPLPNNQDCNALSHEQFEDFEVFGKTSVHLDLSVQMAVHMMVMADVLITSQSSFSYAASVHSAGEVYAIQFWHAALRDWISCSYSFEGATATC
jgi:hypothetical protein